MLHLIELGESYWAGAKWLLEKAGKKSEQPVAGGGRDTDRGVRKERERREVGPLATPTHYTISILFVKVNLSEWQELWVERSLGWVEPLTWLGEERGKKTEVKNRTL